MHDFRIGKPQQHRPGKWRCSIGRAGARTWGPLADSPEKAARSAERAAQAAAGGVMTVRQAIEGYCMHMRTAGARERSIVESRSQMARFFGGLIDRPIGDVTPSRAATLYEELRTLPGPRGKVLAVRTHHECLARAKALFAWCVEQKLAKQSPLAHIKPVGMASRGKTQLRIDEAKILVGLCVSRAREGDDGALAVLLALLLGLRAGEIVSRAVRDLDDGGRILCVDDVGDWKTKTRASRRSVEVPAVLQPLLRERVHGKSATGLLFEAPLAGGRRSPKWVLVSAHRLCRDAGVPLVCAHALRGQHATIAVRAGVSPHLVAGTLGHESSQMTLSAYALPGSEQAATAALAQQRLLN